MTAPGSYNANVVLSADVGQYQQAMGQATAATNDTTGAIKKLGQTYSTTKQSLKDKITAYDRSSIATLAAGTAAAALFQKQLSGLAAQSAVTGRSMKDLKGGIESAFTSLPTARSDLVALATQISQMGITSARDIGQLTAQFTKLAAATGGSSGALAASMLAFTNAMGDNSVGNVKAMSDSLVSLSSHLGVSAQSMLDFSQAIAPLSRVAGITENQVLGLSAAFTKAGADGYVAANTFNSMLENITQLASTGSPELGKYANVLGLTVKQFNALPRAQAVAELFQAINSQGRAGISTLNNLGIDGVRSISALQSVVSQGDLSQLAMGGNTQSGATDKGSKAAFNNLADSLAETRNQMTQYGTYIGTTFLGPLTAAVNVVNTLVRALGMLKPLLAVPMTLAGLAAAPIGGALHFMAPFVAARWLRAGPMGRGFRGGFGAGRRAGASAAEIEAYQQRMALRTGVAGAGLTNEEIDARQAEIRSSMLAQGASETAIQAEIRRQGFYRGASERTANAFATSLGRYAQTVTPANETDLRYFVNGLRNRTLSAPMRLVTGLASTNAQWYRNTYANAGPLGTGAANFETPRFDEVWRRMTTYTPSGMFGRIRGTFSDTRDFYRAGGVSRMFGGGEAAQAEHELVAEARAMRQAGVDTTEAISALRKKFMELTEGLQKTLIEDGKNVSAQEELRRSLVALSRAVAEAAGAEIKASVSSAGAIARALPGSSMVRGAVGGVARFGKGLVMDTIGSPIGAALIGSILGTELLHMYKGAASGNVINMDTNPVAKYNQALGIATTQLASFTQTLDQASLATAKQASTWTQATTVGNAQVAAAPTTAKDSIWADIAKYGGNNPARLIRNIVATMPISSPAALGLIREDMLSPSTGLQPADVQQALMGYRPGKSGMGTPNLRNIGDLIAGTEGRGLGFSLLRGVFGGQPNTSQAGKDFSKFALSYIASQQAYDTTQHGAAYAAQRGLANVTSLGAPQILVAANQGHRYSSDQSITAGTQLAHMLSTVTGGGYGGYQSSLSNGAVDFSKFNMATAAGQQQAVIALLRTTSQGRGYLARVQQSGGTTNAADFMTQLTTLANSNTQSYDDLLRQRGGVLGNYAASSKLINTANTAVNNPTVAANAQQELLNKSYKLTGSYEKASEALEQLAVGSGDLTGPLAQLAEAARSTAQRFLSYRMASMSLPQQAQVVGQQLQDAYYAPKSDPNYSQNLQNWQTQAADMQQQLRQQVIGMIQTEHSYQVETSRSEHDFYQQRAWSSHDFYQQMAWSQQEYQLQTQWAWSDYYKSLRRQALQEAQSIYSPFERVQAQYTTDAGTLLQNLRDQNGDIKRQYGEVHRLKRMGMSQQAIDVLQLANPTNAQETQSIVDSIASDPSIIQKINQAIGVRYAATKQLTQTNINVTFRQQSQDMSQQMARQAQQFATQQAHAETQFKQSMDRQATMFHQQQANAAADLAWGEKQWNQSLSQLLKIAGDGIDKISGEAPKAASIMDNFLNDISTKDGMYFQTIITGADKVRAALEKWRHEQQKIKQTQAEVAGTIYGNATGYPGQPTSTLPSYPVSGSPNYPSLLGVPTRKYHHAMGGISTFAHTASISENNEPEAIIPLNGTGQNFLASMYSNVARDIAQQLRTAGLSMPGGYGGGTTYNMVRNDNSTQFSGAITIQANDTKQIIAELQSQARLKRLTQPASSTRVGFAA